MNSNNKKFIGILAVILAVAVGGAVLAFMVFGRSQAAADDSESGEYPFREAVIEAETIVYGKVLEKDSVVEAKNWGQAVAEAVESRDFTAVTVEVIEAVKGAEDAETILYLEPGKGAGQKNSENADLETVKAGREYVFFLDEQGAALNSQAVVPVKEGKAALKGYMELKCFYDPKTNVKDGIPVDIYIAVINHEYLKWQEEKGYALVMWVQDLVSDGNERATEVFYGKVLEVTEITKDTGGCYQKIRVAVTEVFKDASEDFDTENKASWLDKICNIFKGDTALYKEIEVDGRFKDIQQDEVGIFCTYEGEMGMWIPLTSGYVYISGFPQKGSDGPANEMLIFTRDQFLEVLRGEFE